MREPRLEVSLWGFRINAVGALAVCAAVLIFFCGSGGMAVLART